nr:maltopentaose forming amylase [Pseudomonas sp.]
MSRRLALALAASAVLAGPWAVGAVQAQSAPRTAFVQLFEWKWTDVARECETYLGPKGFAAVQISPPNEHNWVSSGDGAPYPWWMRYQPVSYSLDRSRSGTRAEFQDMVNRCNAAGVGIYVDAVINHMSGGNGGTSSAGRSWSHHNYPGLYGSQDFHHPVCAITNYGDANNVQNCELSGLQDLNTGSSYVRGKISDYLVDLVQMGVKGLRVDAAKHISPTDLGAIIDSVNARTGAARPFWFLEVIGAPGEAVQPSQYFGLGGGQVTVTEFAYGKELYGKFAGGGKLADLQTFGPSWNLMPSSKAIAFVDNHDKQRGHGGGGGYVTYHHGSTYDLANIFMLAWPYGYPALMSATASTRAAATTPATARRTTATARPGGRGTGTPPARVLQPDRGWLGLRAPLARHRQHGGLPQRHRGQLVRQRLVEQRQQPDRLRPRRQGLRRHQQGRYGADAASRPACRPGVLRRDLRRLRQRQLHRHGGDRGCRRPRDAVRTRLWRGGDPRRCAHRRHAAGAAVLSLTFNETADTVWGQNLFVVGNVGALGNWAPAAGAAMTWISGSGSTGQWRATVQLPADTPVQYKYVKKDGAGNVVWESGGNRVVTTPAPGATIAVNDSWK